MKYRRLKMVKSRQLRDDLTISDLSGDLKMQLDLLLFVERVYFAYCNDKRLPRYALLVDNRFSSPLSTYEEDVVVAAVNQELSNIYKFF